MTRRQQTAIAPMRGLLICASLLWTLGACGSEPGSTAPKVSAIPDPPVRRIELLSGGQGLSIEAPRLYKELDSSAPDANWTIDATKPRRGAVPGLTDPRAQDLLLLLNSQDKRIHIPGPFDASAFNRIGFEVVARQKGKVRVQLMRAGKAVGTVASVGVDARYSLQQLQLRLATDGQAGFDSINIVFDGSCGPLALGPITLDLASPLEGLEVLPGDLGHAPLHDRTRLAYGISTDCSLHARIHPRAGDHLHFSARLAAPSKGLAAQALLRLRISTPEGVEAASVPIQLKGDWGSLSLPMDALGVGESYDLEFLVESSDESPVYALLGEPSLHVPDADAPVVLLITSDTHRGDHLGSADGGVYVRTPHLDSLGERGILFERAQASSNITLPSHIALFTGRSPRDTGVRTNLEGMADAAPTLAEAFRSAGWSTIATISARHLMQVGGVSQGFDRLSAPIGGERSGDTTLAQLERWMPDFEGRPLFIWLHLFDPHSPYVPPPEFMGDYEERVLQETPALDAALRAGRSAYRGEVSFLDALIGRALEAPRLAAATIGLTGDHGENLGEHGLLFNHSELYPEVVRVPLILSWPGSPSGLRISDPISHLGLGRTLLDLAGLQGIAFPGTSFLDELAPKRTTKLRKLPIFAIANSARSASISLENHYLILHLTDHSVADGHSRQHGMLELYDLGADPGCLHDLKDSQPDRVRGMRRMLMSWLTSAEDLGWVSGAVVSTEQMEMLAQLGYADQEGSSAGPLIDPTCDCERCVHWR